MAAPDWVSYFAAVTGAVGMITGITGAVVSVKNYRRVSNIKALDLRLELRKLTSETSTNVRSLPELIEHARRSRVNVAAALGTARTGAMEVWKGQCEADLQAAQELQHALPKAAEYGALQHDDLEDRIVEVDLLNGKAKALAAKYRAELAKDDKDREYIRSAHTPR